jgi:hypothetical protein
MRAFHTIGVVATMLLAAGGCNDQRSQAILVRGMHINGYEFDYELAAPTSIMAEAEAVSISTGTHQIVVDAGQRLHVDGRAYGEVQLKDRISILDGKVSVNGKERRPQG